VSFSFSGGLDDALNNILNVCNEQNVPFVSALGRRSLDRPCAKLVPVSVIGIFNFSGSEVSMKHMSYTYL
jgi:selenocysteine insertion sequence-binding protein 2